jgi:hypothetical protein
LGSVPTALVRVAVSGPDQPTGIAVRLGAGAVGGTGTLDADGRATLQLLNAGQHPITELAAWDHDWSIATVIVGAEVEESRETRQRIRDFARARLHRPPGDAFLAEILAAESDY